METTLTRAAQLNQLLKDFVMDAEGELAIALEAFAAAQLSRSKQQGTAQTELIVDRFIIEGRVGDQTPLDLFIVSELDLTEGDRHTLENWKRSFFGLFAIKTILADRFEVMNWLTTKHYAIRLNPSQSNQDVARLKEGDILQAQIAPIGQDEWMFSSAWTLLGNLSKPKLAVAIGNFKQQYKPYLYGDAPELLEEAWLSVERYFDKFRNFFGQSEVTLPGYELNKKLTEFQETMLQESLEASGLKEPADLDHLLDEMEQQGELDLSAEELQQVPEELRDLVKQPKKLKAKPAKVELPAELKKAKQVTVLVHPRWGVMLLPSYSDFVSLLHTEDWKSLPNAENLVKKYLEDPEINYYVWTHLAEAHSKNLERILQDYLGTPDFNLSTDLDGLLLNYHKPSEPELPEIASVPLHLHQLFEEALKETEKDKSKNKSKSKRPKTGFQRS